MSLIFEALQRAESERSGKTGAPPSSATDVLRRAEDQARLQRIAETTTEVENFAAPEGHKLSALGRLALDSFPTIHLTAERNPRLVALADRESPAAEAFRLLGIRLRHLRRERSLGKLLIGSSATDEGKSMVAANLACTLASTSQQNVLLIDGDIRRPSLNSLFRTDFHPGLSEYLRGERKLDESIYRLEEAGLWLMPAGSSSEDQTKLLESSLLPLMLDQLSASFHWIMIDSPPILPLADASIWARLADGILLVTRNGVTEKKKLNRGIEALDEEKLVGAVINSANSTAEGDYYYYRDKSESSHKTDASKGLFGTDQ